MHLRLTGAAVSKSHWLLLTLVVGVVSTSCGEDPEHPPTPRCASYYDQALKAKAPQAAAWCNSGRVMRWNSSKWSKTIDLFYRCAGERSRPAIYLQHGWPTSSFDFQEIFTSLATDHFVCALDMPGYGFADKPDGYPYSLLEDGAIVETFIRDVMKASEVTIVAHDRGDSVSLELLHRYLAKAPGFKIKQFTLSNGSVHLPSAQISSFQKMLLSKSTGPSMARTLTGATLAAAMGVSTFSPPLSKADMDELASVFDFDDGTDRLHETIQYLNERATYEEKRWLAALGKSRMPVTLIWGELDPVAVTAVADHVWDKVLATRPATAHYWRAPCANHYIQNDRPAEVLAILRGKGLPPHKETKCKKTYLHRKR